LPGNGLRGAQFAQLVANQVARPQADMGEWDRTMNVEAPAAGNSESMQTVMSITSDATPAAAISILLAEDDPVTRMLMTRFLKKAGYEVDAVENGAEALERMTRRYYPICITDWEMPEMDGIALTRTVRAAARRLRLHPAAHRPRHQGAHHRRARGRRG
jgi:PleD family two-component response regulator